MTIQRDESCSINFKYSDIYSIDRSLSDEQRWSEIRQLKRRSAKNLSLACVSYRLCKRKILHKKCCQINDLMSFLAFFGIVLMVIDNELMFNNPNHGQTWLSWTMKLLMTISTFFLVALIIVYHYYDVKLYCVNNSVDNWRLAMKGTKIISILLEILICAVHPFPGISSFNDKTKRMNVTSSACSTLSSADLFPVSMEVAFGLPMFVRLYLWCRFLTFHSHMVRDTSSQSLGYLNKVAIDFAFVLKTYFQQYPSRCLIIFCAVVFLIGSWALRACDLKTDVEHISIFDAMWFFMVTFTTVGYGDLTPATYCARGVATLASIIGILVAALLIAIVSQKLTLSRREKYVHKFFLSSELAKERRNQSVNIIIFSWKLWILHKNNKRSSLKFVLFQRRLFEAIRKNSAIKQRERKLTDQFVDLTELASIQRETNSTSNNLLERLTHFQVKINDIDKKLNDLQQTIQTIEFSFDRLFKTAIQP